MTWYYGIFLTVVGAYWGWTTSGISEPFWPGSLQIASVYPSMGSYLFWPAGLVFFTGVLTLFGTWYTSMSITYILTGQILRIERAGIGKQSTEIPLRSVIGVEVLPQKIPLIGTVQVRSMLDTEGVLVIEKIFRPGKFRKEIERKPRRRPIPAARP